jgi:Tfp pilus assembly protein PilF
VQFEAMSVQDELVRAEQYFSRAVRLAPDFAEARLHFGRVLGQLGKNEQAIDELSRAADGLSDSALRYYAGLFLGEVQARTGDLPAARQNLQRAHELYPAAQSPLLALADLARRDNDSVSAAAFLKELLALPHAEQARDDPWWWYSHSQVRDAETRLAAWRASIVKVTAR